MEGSGMLLRDLLKGVEARLLWGEEDTIILGVAMDSRKVKTGDLFVCMEGAHCDGHEFATEALENGARALVICRKDESFIGMLRELCKREGIGCRAVVLAENTRTALARIGAKWYGNPSERLKTIGITGTKGKTTTSYLIKSILENAGRRVGLIGTNEVIIGRKHMHALNTTPESLLLQKYLGEMVDEGADTVVMEVSSQALKLHRTEGIFFDYGIFTNLSPDHISPSEHRDFQEYLECKSQLFRQCEIGLINGDDSYAEKVTAGHTCRIETYGLDHKNQLWADQLQFIMKDGRLGVSFQVKGAMDFQAYLPLPGSFSVYNALAAISICRHFRVRESDIQRSLLAAKVRGRIESVPTGRDYVILIDYAHNPMALGSLLESLKIYHPKRLICLFGCGGDRPVLRRRAMGEISGRLADFTIITDDNPRSEDPAKIREQIKEGVEAVGGEYAVIPGRREAIAYCLSLAQKGDLIVLAGKGHETEQEIGGCFYPMDERKIVRGILQGECIVCGCDC